MNGRTPGPRTYAENAVKRLFQDSRNVREFLALTGAAEAELLDLDRMQLQPTSYVTEELRKRETDIVLEAPVRPEIVPQEVDGLTVYILVEHQSRSDTWMPLRVSDYVIQLFKAQQRLHPERRKLFPVLPIVLHTGKRRWRSPGQLADRVVLGA